MNLNDYPLWTAIVTPFNEDGSLDKESFAGLLKEQEEARNGILVLGSTGEALNLTNEEKSNVLNFSLEQELSVPIMIGVGGSNLTETVEWVEHLNTLPIKALLLVTPLYAKPETEGQFQWFKKLLDTAKHPCMLYNVPSRTGKSLCYDAVRRLESHDKFWALKEASGSVDDFKKYRAAAPSVDVYSGDDGMLPAFCDHGCKGLVSVSSNAWPKQTAEYVRQSLTKELTSDDASLWDACASALFCVSNPIPVKRLLKEEKRIKTSVLKLPLSHLDLSQAATVLEASTRINNWFNKLNK
jgi:4-hydroxy-tetrahydrodipicolinate synthase